MYNSTYAFSENKVINGIELEGLEQFSLTTHWSMSGGFTGGGIGIGTATFLFDWATSGYQGYAQGGMNRLKNEAQYSQNSRNENIPQEVSDNLYLQGKIKADTEIVQGASDIMNVNSTLFSIALGGLGGQVQSLLTSNSKYIP